MTLQITALAVNSSDLPTQEQIDRLAQEGWVHLDNLQRVALCPFARLDDYQRLAEQLAALCTLKERFFETLYPSDYQATAFDRILDTVSALQRELAADMEQAAEGYATKYSPPNSLALDVEVEPVKKRRPAKREKP